VARSSASPTCADPAIAVDRTGRRRALSSGGPARLPSRAAPRVRQVDSLDDQRQLGRFDRVRHRLPIVAKRWAESPPPEALRPHRDSVPIPVHNAYPVAALREEDEQVPTKRVLLEHVPHDHQAVGSLSSVDGLGRHEQPDARRQAQHSSAPRIAITLRSVASETPSFTRTT